MMAYISDPEYIQQMAELGEPNAMATVESWEPCHHCGTLTDNRKLVDDEVYYFCEVCLEDLK